MNVSLKALACCLGLALVLPVPSAAEAPPTTSAAEGALVRYVVADSVAEIALCRLALTKTQNAGVRQFAQRMIADHTRMVSEAMALGRTMNVSELKREPSEEGTVSYVHLSRYSGKMFDENFMLANVDDHLADIETLRHAMEITRTPALHAYETELLPQFETHLRLAQRASDAVAASS